MTSERRHQLQQNDLAEYLGRINRSIEPYSRIIAVVVGVALVALIVAGFIRTSQSEKRADSTWELLQASELNDPEILANISQQYPQTAAGAWSRLYQGNQYLAEGMQMLFTGGLADDLLKQATDAFNEAIQASDDQLLRSRAHFGVARAAEAQGHIDEAIAAYQECIDVGESKAMTKRAQERIDSLSEPETKEFLAWFAKQDFSLPDPSLPPSLPGDIALPELPDLTLPDLSPGTDSESELSPEMEGGLGLPSSDAPSSETPGSETPDTQPSAEASSDSSSEGETQPSADQPAAPADGDASATDDASDRDQE